MEQYSLDKKFVLMSRDEVRGVDAWAINELGVPGVVLMENAGRSCAEFIIEKLEGSGGRKVCIFCGTGNNGGDGYVIARHLLNSGFEAATVICGDYEKIRDDARINLEILERMGGAIEQLAAKDGGSPGRIEELAEGADMIVDALFGTGLAGQLRDGYGELVESINGLDFPIFAVDIPSGLDCDSGRPLGAAIRAAYTVTFVAAKKGFANPDAVEFTGEIYIASIGVEPPQG
ncbi:MAG: NAD(P)H-hydrate epimerase [Planctomycetota bacterium]|jgi:NAD(P)H-hydrate epimerase